MQLSIPLTCLLLLLAAAAYRWVRSHYFPTHKDPWFAWLWRALGPGVDRALAGLKRELLSPLTGRVVELGAGDGASLRHLTSARVTSLVLVEPNTDMHASLHAAVRASAHLAGAAASVVACGAEALPLPDASVDAVVSVLTLCSVGDARACVREAHRILRPGGRFVFLEHVAATSSCATGCLQRVADATAVYGCLAGGCHLHRDTLGTIRGAAVWASLTAASTPHPRGFPMPLTWGVAVK